MYTNKVLNMSHLTKTGIILLEANVSSQPKASNCVFGAGNIRILEEYPWLPSREYV